MARQGSMFDFNSGVLSGEVKAFVVASCPGIEVLDEGVPNESGVKEGGIQCWYRFITRRFCVIKGNSL